MGVGRTGISELHRISKSFLCLLRLGRVCFENSLEAVLFKLNIYKEKWNELIMMCLLMIIMNEWFLVLNQQLKRKKECHSRHTWTFFDSTQTHCKFVIDVKIVSFIVHIFSLVSFWMWKVYILQEKSFNKMVYLTTAKSKNLCQPTDWIYIKKWQNRR